MSTPISTISTLYFDTKISFDKDGFADKFPAVCTGVNYEEKSKQFSDSLKERKLIDIKEDTELDIDNDSTKSYKDLFGSVASVGQSYFSDDDFGKILSCLWDENEKIFKLNEDKLKNIEKYFNKKQEEKKEQKKNNKDLKKYATPNAATCRLLMALFPNSFCPIPTPKKVDYLIDKLIKDEFLKKDEIKQLRREFKNSWLTKWCVFNNILYKIFNSEEEKKGAVSPWGAIVRYGREEQRKEIVGLLKENHNIILTGAPGTGKTYRAKEIAVEMAKTNTNLQNLNGDVEKDFIELQKQGYVDFVQFHPSYDYTDFVEGLRPNNNANGFERRDGIFKTFCAKAANDANKDNKYVIIIDEINRGEISKILGELFFSIDPGYRGEKGKVATQYQNLIKEDETMPDGKKYPFINGFYVPEKVFIIGTMNDIDRSVESMDFAFRRRFAFKEIKAEDSKAMLWDGDNYQVLEDVMDRVNNELIKPQYGLSEAYQIGASYFNKIKKNGNSNNIDYKKELKTLWEFHIKGLVFEYLRGKPNTMDLLKQLESAYCGKDINTEEGQEEGEKAENVNDTKG